MTSNPSLRIFCDLPLLILIKYIISLYLIYEYTIIKITKEVIRSVEENTKA